MSASQFPIPETMKAWCSEIPASSRLVDKRVPAGTRGGPGPHRRGRDLRDRPGGHQPRSTRLIGGDLPFNRNFTPWPRGTWGPSWRWGRLSTSSPLASGSPLRFTPGVAGARAAAGNLHVVPEYGRNYGEHDKGHRANGFTTDGGFAQYAINHVNTLVRVPPALTDEVATLIVTAGTAMYGLDVLGGLVAGESLVVTGAGPIGLLAVAVGKALGANPVIVTDIVDDRLAIGTRLGADRAINGPRHRRSRQCGRPTAGVA